MTHPRACRICNVILRLFQEAADSGVRFEFTVDERKALMERCQRSIAETTEILASRGWFELPDGSWRRLDLDEIQ